jgi:ketosteroid isomerase-like protein
MFIRFSNMNSIRKNICIILAMFTLISCVDNEKENRAYLEAELPVIKKTISDAIGWAKNKDFDLLYSIISNDSDYVEVDPGKMVVRGFNEFRKNETFWGNPEFKAIRYEIRDLKISVSQSGNFAWYYCILDDVNEWKGKPASWLNTRWTGVLEKRQEKWVIVQMHFSFAQE